MHGPCTHICPVEHSNPARSVEHGAGTRINTRTQHYVLLLQVLVIPVSGLWILDARTPWPLGVLRVLSPGACVGRKSPVPQLASFPAFPDAYPDACILHPASCIRLAWFGSGLRLACRHRWRTSPLCRHYVATGGESLVSGCWVQDSCKACNLRAQKAHWFWCRRSTLAVPFPHTTPRWCTCPFWCSQNASTRFVVVAVLVYTKHCIRIGSRDNSRDKVSRATTLRIRLFSTFLKNIFGVNTL